MKKLLATATLIAILSVSALAGDIDVPKPTPPPESMAAKIVRLLFG